MTDIARAILAIKSAAQISVNADDIFEVEEGYESISEVDTTFVDEGSAFESSEEKASDF